MGAMVQCVVAEDGQIIHVGDWDYGTAECPNYLPKGAIEKQTIELEVHPTLGGILYDRDGKPVRSADTAAVTAAKVGLAFSDGELLSALTNPDKLTQIQDAAERIRQDCARLEERKN